MKIVFDAFWWFEGPISNRNVMQEVIREWRSCFPSDEIHVVTDPRAKDSIALELLLPAEQVHALKVRQHGLAVLMEYPFLLRRIGADHVLTHNFVPPFTRRASAFVHDLIFVTSPQWFTWTERAYFKLLKLSLSNAWQIFSSTRTEVSRIERVLGRAEGVHPVGLAISSDLAAAVPRMPAQDLGEYAFTLIVGRLNERKNLAYGLRALSSAGLISPEVPVVVVGEKHGRAFELPHDLRTLVGVGAIRFLGFMDTEELAWLYANAKLVVFPTLDEGFGLPVIEARYFGAPLALSDIPVMREVAGDAPASFFSLGDTELAAASLAAAQLRVSSAKDHESRTSVSRQYAWRNTVESIRESMQKKPLLKNRSNSGGA